jgi:hypothetical protein
MENGFGLLFLLFLLFFFFLLFLCFLSVFVVWGRRCTITKCNATRAIVKFGYTRKVGDLSRRRR